MHTVVRIYRGATGLGDQLAGRTAEIRSVLERVPGFIGYTLVQTTDGVCSVTTCRDRLGTEESNRLAAEWLKENLPAFSAKPPEVLHGEAVLNFGVTPATA